MRNSIKKEKIMRLAKQVLQQEGKAVSNLANVINETFLQAIEIIRNCQGKVVVAGLGKGGRVGTKIAASLSSLGTPAFFLHADEALHGDSGVVTNKDVLLVISHSGKTSEVLAFMDIVKKIGCPIISIAGKKDCTLARMVDVALTTGVSREADPMNLAPTTSAITVLALGDALAVCLSQLKGFTKEDFALYHPGGALGQRLSKEKR
ncbi:Arabinose 5-phosphate isomerase KdsD [subsurface metagenome]